MPIFPTPIETDNAPFSDKIYTHQYAASAVDVNRQVTLQAFSGTSCISEKTLTISVKAAPGATFATVPSLCLNDNDFQLTQGRDANNLQGTFYYSGTGVSAGGLFTPALAGVGANSVLYTYVANNGCRDSIAQTVVVLANPVVTLPSTVRVLEGGSAILEPLITGNPTIFNWSPATYLSNATIKNPKTTPLANITYRVVASAGACQGFADVSVVVLHALGIPNAFSPNGDGINDTWNIPALKSYPDCEVQVFNRYGKIVYTSRGYSQPWTGTYNGSQLAVGVYYYIIDPKNGKNTYNGTVTILR